MQRIADLFNSYFKNENFDASKISDVEIKVGKEMKVDGWISMSLGNEEYSVLKFDNGVYANQGFLLSHEKVLKVLGNQEIDGNSYGEESTEKGIVDLEHGSRFEGLVLKESGIPFGFGEIYEDDGLLIYKGIVINWKRFGYGKSYHNNGMVEYEGYWCDDYPFGLGKMHNRRGNLVYEGNWYREAEANNETYYGNGHEPISVKTKHLNIGNSCVLKDWDVSLFYNLESIDIGEDCFESVKTFRIDGLNQLKSLKINYNSFTGQKDYVGNDETKSFHIVNCESLESIEIARYSFSDFGGEFEMRNLNSLRSIVIGEIGTFSWNFCCCSFVLRGIATDNMLNR